MNELTQKEIEAINLQRFLEAKAKEMEKCSDYAELADIYEEIVFRLREEAEKETK